MTSIHDADNDALFGKDLRVYSKTELETEKMDSVESIEAQIKVLQSKLEFYKELEKTPSPVEEAFKDNYGVYPNELKTTDDFNCWKSFKRGYTAAQKDYKVEEHQEPVKQKDNLYDICADWYKDYDEDHPIEDLVEYIVRNWLPKPSDGGGAWVQGFNSYHKILIDTLEGGND